MEFFKQKVLAIPSLMPTFLGCTEQQWGQALLAAVLIEQGSAEDGKIRFVGSGGASGGYARVNVSLKSRSICTFSCQLSDPPPPPPLTRDQVSPLR